MERKLTKKDTYLIMFKEYPDVGKYYLSIYNSGSDLYKPGYAPQKFVTITQRTATLFVLTLPVIGILERYGLKDKAVDFIKGGLTLLGILMAHTFQKPIQ